MMEFVEGLRRGVDRAGFEVDKLLRANRVRSRISALRSEEDVELRDMGRHVMELYGRSEDVPAGLRERCEKVKKLRSEIAEREAELDAINNEEPPETEPGGLTGLPGTATKCPVCGHTVPEAANFCPNCGTKVASSAEAAEQPAEAPTGQAEPPAPAG